jgi:hypothetical protein
MIDISNLQAIIIPFIVTLFFFYIEACIHFHMGKYETIGFKIPPFYQNIRVIGIIAVFALLSVGTSSLLKLYVTK